MNIHDALHVYKIIGLELYLPWFAELIKDGKELNSK